VKKWLDILWISSKHTIPCVRYLSMTKDGRELSLETKKYLLSLGLSRMKSLAHWIKSLGTNHTTSELPGFPKRKV